MVQSQYYLDQEKDFNNILQQKFDIISFPSYHYSIQNENQKSQIKLNQIASIIQTLSSKPNTNKLSLLNHNFYDSNEIATILNTASLNDNVINSIIYLYLYSINCSYCNKSIFDHIVYKDKDKDKDNKVTMINSCISNMTTKIISNERLVYQSDVFSSSPPGYALKDLTNYIILNLEGERLNNFKCIYKSLLNNYYKINDCQMNRIGYCESTDYKDITSSLTNLIINQSLIIQLLIIEPSVSLMSHIIGLGVKYEKNWNRIVETFSYPSNIRVYGDLNNIVLNNLNILLEKLSHQFIIDKLQD